MSLIITTAGLAAAVHASNLGVQYKITHISIGTEGYIPSSGQTALVNEIMRKPITKGSVINQTQLHFETIWNGTEEFEGKELGYWLEDGTLFAVDSRDGDVITYKRKNSVVTEACDLNLSGSGIDSITVSLIGQPNNSAFPVNATLALHVNETLYENEYGELWLRSGEMRTDIENFPLATRGSVSQASGYTQGDAIDLTDDIWSINNMSNQYGSRLYFARQGMTSAVYYHDVELNETVTLAVSNSVSPVACASEDIFYSMSGFSAPFTLWEYQKDGTSTGNTWKLDSDWRKLIYIGSDADGPVFYGVRETGEYTYEYEICHITMTTVTSVYLFPDDITSWDIAHIPGSSTIEYFVPVDSVNSLSAVRAQKLDIETMQNQWSRANANSNIFELRHLEIESGNMLKSEYVYRGEVEGALTLSHYDLSTSQLWVEAMVNSSESPYSATLPLVIRYEDTPAVGLRNEAIDPVTQVPIYLRIG